MTGTEGYETSDIPSRPKVRVAIWCVPSILSLGSALLTCTVIFLDISGGGPGGLALAVTLARYNNPVCPIAVDIYESQPQLATVGAGISVWPRTHALLRRLGLMDMLKGELGLETEEHRTEEEGVCSFPTLNGSIPH